MNTIIPVRCYTCGKVLAGGRIKFKDVFDQIIDSEIDNNTYSNAIYLYKDMMAKRYTHNRIIDELKGVDKEAIEILEGRANEEMDISTHYERMLERGFSVEKALDYLGFMRPCCRMNFFNPTVLPSTSFDHGRAFVDLTKPNTSLMNSMKSTNVMNEGITLKYHTVVPGELDLPKVPVEKINKVQNEVFMEDVEPLTIYSRRDVKRKNILLAR